MYTANGSSSRRSSLIPIENEKLYSSNFKSKTCILQTAQIPEGAHLYRSKTKNYTAQMSKVKPVYCKRLKFQKELTFTDRSSFRSKNLYTANGSSSRRSSLIPFKKEKLYSTSLLQTAQVPEGANLYQSKRKMYTAQVSEVKTCILQTAQVPEGAHLYRSKRKNYTAKNFKSKTCILQTAQVPEGAHLYRSKTKNYTAQISEVKTCILQTAQIPEGAHLYRSKTKNYTAQMSKVKPVYCKRLKFQKELTYNVQKGKIVQLKFQK